MLFSIAVMCEPRNASSWFEGCKNGLNFEALNRLDAQRWIEGQCLAAGTLNDPNYSDCCPQAVIAEVITPADEDALMQWANCAIASVNRQGDVWIENPMSGHWLNDDRKAEFMEWRAHH